jgi:hypothetical protein
VDNLLLFDYAFSQKISSRGKLDHLKAGIGLVHGLVEFGVMMGCSLSLMGFELFLFGVLCLGDGSSFIDV